jgi:superfamily II DNA/RNA helicase
MSTKFFTNQEDNTLLNKLQGLLGHNPMLKCFDAVVGFLRSSGYFALRPFLSNLDKVRVLIGIDVDKYIVEAQRNGNEFMGADDEVKKECLEIYKSDIENSHYSKEVETGILQMVEDIMLGKLELRAHPSKKIHAKIYILYPADFDENTLNAAVITGSSNLSGNGLGISNERQYEFNVLLREYNDVAFAKEEFEKLWKDAEGCPIEATDIKRVIDNSYLSGDATPYEVYMKMLMEFFEDKIFDEQNGNAYEMPKGYKKLDYQVDAVDDGYRKLIKYDGLFLSDVVGLGKTIIATMIAKKFLFENGHDKTKILVVYPPAVEQNWKDTFHDFGIDKYTKFISNGSLKKILDDDDFNYWKADEYDLVLIDEAHKFRNHDTGKFQQMQEICKMPRTEVGNVPGLKKKVILISATPMNNSPEDIYHQILLFQDPRRCTIEGVPDSNLTSFFSPIIQEFKKLKSEPDYSLDKYKKLSEKVRDRVIKPITVRRTRTDILNIARYAKDLGEFPKVEKPKMEQYILDEKEESLFYDSMQILINEIKYSRYQAIANLLPNKSEGLYDNAEVISKSLAYIMKTSLVKRLESSFYAFIKSLERFKNSNRYMINMFDNDKVIIAPDLDINKMYSDGMSDEDIEKKVNEKAENNPKNHIFHKDDFVDGFYQSLLKDQKQLDALYESWQTINPEKDDPKFDKFLDLLNHEFFKKDINDGQKLVIFSESEDTIYYLTKRLNRKDILTISAQNRNEKFNTIRANFDANYDKTQKDDYKILIATNALAEGINLHRSNVIINYDTPWNSTILMQRIGRVNRIGSKAKKIYNYVFYPSQQGDDQINLKRTSLAKLQTFHTMFGEDSQIYSTDEIIDLDLEKLFTVGLPEEELNKEVLFFEELRDLYVNNRKEYNRIHRLSLRSRTGRDARTINGVTLSKDTLVFMKTNLRKNFFRVSDGSNEELTSLEALEYFKADKEEKKVPRIEQHHDHVAKAKALFDAAPVTDFSLESSASRANPGAQVTTAVSLLNAICDKVEDTNQRRLISQLRSLAERGVITFIPKRLERLQKKFKKNLINYDEVYEEVMIMAKKYDAYYLTEEESKREKESASIIILSESFN